MFGMLVLIVLIELVLVTLSGLVLIAFLNNSALIVAMPMVSMGTSIVLIVWPLLKKHFDLVTKHLTEKEWEARKKTCQRRKRKIDDDLIANMPFRQKCKNVI